MACQLSRRYFFPNDQTPQAENIRIYCAAYLRARRVRGEKKTLKDTKESLLFFAQKDEAFFLISTSLNTHISRS
jgi:hypothetical protein